MLVGSPQALVVVHGLFGDVPVCVVVAEVGFEAGGEVATVGEIFRFGCAQFFADGFDDGGGVNGL